MKIEFLILRYVGDNPLYKRDSGKKHQFCNKGLASAKWAPKINYPSATPTKLRRLLLRFYGKFMERIGLKAPGNYSASFWFNNFSILLLETQKSQNVMISGFLGPVRPFIYGFKYFKILFKYKKVWGHFRKYDFVKSRNFRNHFFCKCWKRWAPENDEYPFENLGNFEYGANIYQKTWNRNVVIRRRH